MRAFVKPGASGMIVRDPISKAVLPETGDWKPLVGPEGRYWRRRINCGDVVALKYDPPREEPVAVAEKQRKRRGEE